MSIETSITALTTQTSELLDVVTALKNGVSAQIAAAVLVSTNASIVPLMTVATNLINTQATLVTHINLTM